MHLYEFIEIFVPKLVAMVTHFVPGVLKCHGNVPQTSAIRSVVIGSVNHENALLVIYHTNAFICISSYFSRKIVTHYSNHPLSLVREAYL